MSYYLYNCMQSCKSFSHMCRHRGRLAASALSREDLMKFNRYSRIEKLAQFHWKRSYSEIFALVNDPKKAEEMWVIEWPKGFIRGQKKKLKVDDWFVYYFQSISLVVGSTYCWNIFL